MSRILAIVGSAIFLVIAPGIVAGYIPWRICRWHVGAPLLAPPPCGSRERSLLRRVSPCFGTPSLASPSMVSVSPRRSSEEFGGAFYHRTDFRIRRMEFQVNCDAGEGDPCARLRWMI